MSTENEVREASVRFYAALNRMLQGDAAGMAEIWSHGEDVTAMHPLGGRDTGWAQVEGSWAKVAGLATGGSVELRGQRILVAGDLALETGEEHGRGDFGKHQVLLEQRVTNVYRREGGAWKVVHHHTDISLGLRELVRSMPSGG